MPKVLMAFFKASESDDDDDVDGVEGHPGLLFESERSSAWGLLKNMAGEKTHASLLIWGTFSVLTTGIEPKSFIQQLPTLARCRFCGYKRFHTYNPLSTFLGVSVAPVASP